MDQVPLSDTQLDYLAAEHPRLGSIYGGTLPCDKLPKTLQRSTKTAFVVNTDPAGMPGSHWIALWTEGEKCELFDSFALPLKTYPDAAPLIQWLNNHYEAVEANADSVQSLTSQTCGFYAIFYLMAKSRGASMLDFTSHFKKHDLIGNDKLVTDMMKYLIEKDSKWEDVCNRCFNQRNK